MKRIGFIGYGLRSNAVLSAFENIEAEIAVSAVADPRWAEIRAQKQSDPNFSDTRYYEDAESMLAAGGLDGVFVGTRCSLHERYARMALAAELPLFLEKPVCMTEDQYFRLRDAARGREKRVVVSFPLRLSEIVREVKHIVESGEIGTLTMVQAINNVPYGSVYYHSWYRDPVETGGLFLQKMTHDIDYITSVTGERPVSVCAKTTKMHFKGDRAANMTCPNCPEYHTCLESSYVVKHILKEDVQGEMCCFAKDTGNEDGASVIFTTQSGMLISYNQNFIVKKSAARRGARFIGTKGSVEFDFVSAQIRLDRYFSPQTVTHEFHFPAGMHFGGDEALALAFMDVLDGRASASDLTAGLESAKACLTARRADEEGRFLPIEY